MPQAAARQHEIMSRRSVCREITEGLIHGVVEEGSAIITDVSPNNAGKHRQGAGRVVTAGISRR